MKYNLNCSCYCDGSIYEVNKLPARSYFIPYPNRAFADAVSLHDKRYNSPMVECLNGQWDFRFYPRPAELPDVLDTNTVDWDKIAVPGCWQFQGYDRPFYLNVRYQFPFDPPNIPKTEKVGRVFTLMGTTGIGPRYETPEDEYNFVGVYRRFLYIDRAEEKHVISFLGVASCLELYVNGEFIGYSEGSHNIAEFDLTGFLHNGENELLAVVRRWCSGTYLECQDMFRNNGIFRDVLLRKGCSIRDVDVKTEKTGRGYRLFAKVLLDCEQMARISLTGHGMNQSATVHGDKGAVEFECTDVLEWTAETPILYDLYFETDTECVKCRVGFRDVRIEGRRFLFNGKAIKFHGVNHHDTNPTTGYTMTPEEIERDIALCKEYNIDTIRTAHYPPDPYLLELCDEMGIYVVDEADIETHGSFVHKFPPNYGRITHDPFWEKHYLDRGIRLYERDKLHPCVVMWSLGNEAGGYRNTDAMYAELKKRTVLPIHYEGAIHSKRKAYDVGSQMYPSVEQVHRVGTGAARIKQLNDRPYFLCEYAHAMGVGPGAMEDYWEEIYAYESLMGGCIWEMVDHAVLHSDGSYTYGGDHGEWCHDGNFCVDGIFYPDRTPSTGAKIAKFVYRPIRVSYLGDNHFEFFNTTGFTSGEEYSLHFQWSDGRFCNVSPCVLPMDKLVREVKPEGQSDCGGRRLEFVTVTTVDKRTGREVAKEQIVLSSLKRLDEALLEKADWPNEFVVGEESVGISGVLVSGTPYTVLTRVATDNDKTVTGKRPLAEFNDGTERVLNIDRQNGKTVVHSRLTFKKSTFLCTDTYESVVGGVLVTSRLHCERGRGDLPRFGKCYRLDSVFDRVSYLGRNGESYCDMKDQCQIEQVGCMVCDMTEPNIRPQESGNRMDCQYVTLTDGKRSATFTAVDRSFELAVKPYSDTELSAMKHREDEKVTGIYVTIQVFQMGIGTGSCGPATRKQYKYPKKRDYTFSYLISWEN